MYDFYTTRRTCRMFDLFYDMWVPKLIHVRRNERNSFNYFAHMQVQQFCLVNSDEKINQPNIY